MKIAHISSSVTSGGASIAAFRLHQRLMDCQGVESHIIQRLNVDDDAFVRENNIHTLYTSKSLPIRVRKKLNIQTEHYHWKKIHKCPKNWDIMTFPTTSYRIEDDPLVQSADIIHLHWVSEFLNYPSFFKNIKQPIVWTLHDINPMMGIFHFEGDEERNIDSYGKVNQRYKKLKAKSINKKDDISVVCLSDWMKSKVEKSIALGRYPVYKIPNGLELSKFPAMTKNEARKELKIDNGLPSILLVGVNFDSYQKGFTMMPDVISRIKHNINFITVGGGDNYLKFGNNINHIHFNHINDIELLNTIYSAADITVIPSREDNLPNVMLESFANGTPVISFSNGGMAEHIITGKNGILIENEISSEALRKNIVDFLDNKYNFEPDYIKKYAENHFSEQRQLDAYIRLYNKILCR